VGGDCYALATYDDHLGLGPVLYVGGILAGTPSGGAHLGRWGGCAPFSPGAAYCFGDGSGSACPCGNESSTRAGCTNSSGRGAVLSGSGSGSVAMDDLELAGGALIPGESALLFAGLVATGQGAGVFFGDGLRCAGGSVQRLGVRVPAVDGTAFWGPGLAAMGDFGAGDTRRFQIWYRDPTGSPCGAGFNLSNGYAVQLVP
jgi:hypothetical protein